MLLSLAGHACLPSVRLAILWKNWQENSRTWKNERLTKLPRDDYTLARFGHLREETASMADVHILKIDSLPVVERGNGIRTIPLVTKEMAHSI